jgi:C_GCAxxG_C_C family probable redox protein
MEEKELDKTTGVIVRDGKEFDCAESVLIIVNGGHPLPGFESNIMKAASPLGGGVGRWGSACGAATGAVMALGLVYGTDGEESLEEFQGKREHLFELGRVFMREFEEAFGSVNCSDLFFGLFPWTEESEARYVEIKAQGLVKCDDYIDWAAKRVLETLGEG